MERPDPLEDLPLALPEDLADLTAALDKVGALDLDGLPAAVRAQRVLVLQRLASRLDGQWLRELAGVDALGAAGADEGVQAPSTAGWLRRRLRMGAGSARQAVHTARAVFRGPSPAPPTPSPTKRSHRLIGPPLVEQPP